MRDDEFQNDIEGDEYKIWKKNSPYLYDLFYNKSLEWPALTVSWSKRIADLTDSTKQELIYGTHTSGEEDNYLIFAQVKIPNKNCTGYPEEDPKRDDENKKISSDEKIKNETCVKHHGDVNKIRVHPTEMNIVATKSSSGESFVSIYDKYKHENKSTLGPQIRLTGHTKEGYGLNWNPINTNILASGSDDNLVCIWDVNYKKEAQKMLAPTNFLFSHTGIVEDVVFSHGDPNVLLSVSDDHNMKV